MTKLLMSCCNQGASGPHLIAFSYEDGIKPITLSGILQVTGLVQIPSGWILGIQEEYEEHSSLLFLDADLKEERRISLTQVKDIHSIVLYDHDTLLCVSTGTDEIKRVKHYNTNEFEQAPFFSFCTDWDQHHINSIAFGPGGNIHFSLFGERESVDQSWREISNGVIRSLHGTWHHEGLKHPHSLKFLPSGEWIVCESIAKKITFGSGREVEIGSYTRGLTWDDDFFYVGCSSGRDHSRSTGKVVDPIVDLRVGITVVSREDFRITDFVDFSPIISEIYDVNIIKSIG